MDQDSMYILYAGVLTLHKPTRANLCIMLAAWISIATGLKMAEQAAKIHRCYSSGMASTDVLHAHAFKGLAAAF